MGFVGDDGTHVFSYYFRFLLIACEGGGDEMTRLLSVKNFACYEMCYTETRSSMGSCENNNGPSDKLLAS